MEDYYPAWLYQGFIDGDLPWDAAKEFSFQKFSEKYTLHDSIWIGLFYDIAYENSAILAIIWDAAWLPDEIAKSTSVVAEWPLLFIGVENVLQVSTCGYKDIQGLQRGIGTAEIKEVNRKNLLLISDHYGGNVEISFEGKLKFLALDVNKDVLPI